MTQWHYKLYLTYKINKNNLIFLKKNVNFVLQPKTPSPKKQKIDEKGDVSSSLKENIQVSPNTPLTATSLSPEQKTKIEENKLAARMRLAAKTSNSLLVDVGPSWFKALESEFSKQYFNDVSAFHPSWEFYSYEDILLLVKGFKFWHILGTSSWPLSSTVL